MGKRKRRSLETGLHGIPNLGVLTFVIGASRATLGLFLTLGLWRRNTPLGRILLALLGVSIVVLGVTDRRAGDRNLTAAILSVALCAGTPALLLALGKSPWAAAGFGWMLALFTVLFFTHRRPRGRKKE